MGVLKEIGKPLGAFYPSKSFNQPIASVSLCTSARSFFFSMSIASRYTRICFLNFRLIKVDIRPKVQIILISRAPVHIIQRINHRGREINGVAFQAVINRRNILVNSRCRVVAYQAVNDVLAQGNGLLRGLMRHNRALVHQA